MEASKAEPTAKLALKLTADSWGDIMDAFPILALSFMAHFNMLSVGSSSAPMNPRFTYPNCTTYIHTYIRV